MGHIITPAAARVAIGRIVLAHTRKDKAHSGYFEYKDDWSHERVAQTVSMDHKCTITTKHVLYQIKTVPELIARPFWKPRFAAPATPPLKTFADMEHEGEQRNIGFNERLDGLVSKVHTLGLDLRAVTENLKFLGALAEDVKQVEEYLTRTNPQWRDKP